MLAGSLDRRVTILRHDADATNDLGEPVESWTASDQVWASKSDVSDAERVKAMGVGSKLSTRFVVRSASLTRSITTQDRLRYDGRDYEITGLKEIGRRVGIEISASTVDDQA